MIRSKKAGISLIALVVTIIVLLILTAAVVVTFREGGIVDRAKESVFKSDIQTYKEVLLIKNAEYQIDKSMGEEVEELNAATYEEIQAILPEFKEEYEGIVAIVNGELVLGADIEDEGNELYAEWLGELGIGEGDESGEGTGELLASVVSVGDYVQYNYTAPSTPYSTNIGVSTQTFDSATGGNAVVNNWRVLSVSNGSVKLISESPVSSISLYGGNAYVNGPTVLNEMCAELYASDIGIARSIDVDDVDAITGYDGSSTYPQGGIDTTITKDQVVTMADIGSIPENEYVTAEQVRINSYKYDASTLLTDTDSIEYTLLFGEDDMKYVLASTSAYPWLSYINAYLKVRYVENGKVEEYQLLDTDSLSAGATLNAAFRPIVTLNTGLTVTSNTGDGQSASTPWIIAD